MEQAQVFECQDAAKEPRVETNLGNLMCTTIDGYLTLEAYVDAKEKKVRELERQLAQCKRR